MSKGMFSGQLCPQKDSKQPVYWWVELYSWPVGCLTVVFQHWPLQAIEWGQILAASRKAHASEYSPKLPLLLCLFLQLAAATSSHSTSTGDPPIPAGNLVLNPMKSLLFFPWVLVCKRPCVHPQEWSFCFPQSYGIPAIQPHWPSKPDFLWTSSSHCWTPGVRSLTWGSELSTSVGELPVCGLPVCRIWDLIFLCSSYAWLWSLLCLWM